MRFILLTVAMIAAGTVLHQFLPWWAIWCAGLLIGFLLKEEKAMMTFFIGFLGAAILWGGYAFWLNSGNDGIMASRIGALFGGVGAMTLITLTALFGGLFGGLGTLCAYYGRSLFHRSL